MTLGTITMFVYYATVYTAIQDVIEPRLRGFAVAIYFCCMYIFGASLGPVGTGFLSDHFAKQGHDRCRRRHHDRSVQGHRPA